MLYLITFLSVFFVLEEWIFRDGLFRRLTLDRVCLNPDSSLALSDLDIVDLLSKLDPRVNLRWEIDQVIHCRMSEQPKDFCLSWVMPEWLNNIPFETSL